MGWDVTVQRVRGGRRPVPKQVVGLAACRRYCLSSKTISSLNKKRVRRQDERGENLSTRESHMIG